MENNKHTTTKEIMDKHMADPNHHITEQEIANADIGLDAESDAQLIAETKAKIEELGTDTAADKTTSYDLLDSAPAD